MVAVFIRLFLVFLVVSILFQLVLGWDELAKAGWPMRLLLAKFPAAVGVALLAAGATSIFSPRRQQENDREE